MRELRDPVALYDSLQERCTLVQAAFLAMEREGLIPLPVALAWITAVRDEARGADIRDLDAIERLGNRFVRQRLMLKVGIPVTFMPNEPDARKRAAEKLRLFGPQMSPEEVAEWADRMAVGVCRPRPDDWWTSLTFGQKLARLATLELIEMHWRVFEAGIIDKRTLRRRVAAGWRRFEWAETLDDFRAVADEASAAAIREEWRMHPAPPLPDPSELAGAVEPVEEADDDKKGPDGKE